MKRGLATALVLSGCEATVLPRAFEVRPFKGAGGQFQLWLVRSGDRTLLDGTAVPVDLGAPHTVALGLHGDQLTCALDGNVLLHATDATFSAGRVALVASAGEGAEFGAVRVGP